MDARSRISRHARGTAHRRSVHGDREQVKARANIELGPIKFLIDGSFGSITSILRCPRLVRSYSNIVGKADMAAGVLGAKPSLSRRSKSSTTASARSCVS